MQTFATSCGLLDVDGKAAPVTGTAAYNLRFFKYLKARAISCE